MFSGLVNSFRGFMGWDTLEVESGGQQEDQINHHNTDERQSLFKQLSQFMGKDVTSMISLPVWIFEPISFLQVMCEPFQFEELLQKAASDPDPNNRAAYLAAFIVAGYSCATRNKKPFNPLLGETYEYVHPEGKYKFFAEQVSHHPPIGVAEAKSDLYTLRYEMELKTKFSGNSTDVYVYGSNHFQSTKYNDKYSWGHLDTCAHNIIIGGMWVDHFGTLELENETTGTKCVIKVSKAGWLGSGRFETRADVYDADGKLRVKVRGKWNDSLHALKVDSNGEEVGEPIPLWKRPAIPHNKWNWPKYNEELCRLDDSLKSILPPTDSRLRTDRSALEAGDMDLAGKEKHRLEEDQRQKRKEREAKGEVYKPRYFESVEDAKWGHVYKYIGDYWEAREKRVEELKNKQPQNQPNDAQ